MPADGVGVPWSVQIELVEGCNRLCAFCGLNGTRTKPGEDIREMSFHTANVVSLECHLLAPFARYEFAMHGEPLLHRDPHGLISLFRTRLPRAQFQLTTNGRRMMGHMQSWLDSLFRSGIDFVLLDTYPPEKDALIEEAKALRNIRVIDFYGDGCKVSPWHNHRRQLSRTLFLMGDIGAENGKAKNRTLFNHAGNSGSVLALSAPRALKCTIPFREISIKYNGDVNICCMDYGSEFVVGTAGGDTLLTEIWNGALFGAVRRILYAKDRRFSPCVRCDHPSGMRVGLLPRQDPPSSEDYALVKNHIHICADTKKRNRLETIVQW